MTALTSLTKRERDRERERRWCAANRDRVNARARKYRADNPEKAKASFTKWRESHLEQERERQRAYREANREALRTKDRQRYAENRERYSEKNCAYYAKNAERRIEERKAWAKKNPDMARALVRKRRARKMKVGGTHTIVDIQEIKLMQRDRCAACRIRLGTKYEVDHIVPLSKGGHDGRSNLQLLCPPCNRSKKDAEPQVFYRRTGRLL